MQTKERWFHHIPAVVVPKGKDGGGDHHFRLWCVFIEDIDPMKDRNSRRILKNYCEEHVEHCFNCNHRHTRGNCSIEWSEGL